MWVPFMKVNFKKEGGGEYVPSDLIRLSFDEKNEDEKPMSFKEAKELLGSRIKK